MQSIPGDLAVNIGQYSHQVRFILGGKPVKHLVVSFTIGSLGPFFWEATDDADAQGKLRTYIASKLDEVRALQGNY